MKLFCLTGREAAGCRCAFDSIGLPRFSGRGKSRCLLSTYATNIEMQGQQAPVNEPLTRFWLSMSRSTAQGAGRLELMQSPPKISTLHRMNIQGGADFSRYCTPHF